MPRWLCWWAEKDEQDAVNVAELLEQVERQRAIIEEQAKQIEAWKAKGDQWDQALLCLEKHEKAMLEWTKNYPIFAIKEVTE
jgi:hypothetical protein